MKYNKLYLILLFPLFCFVIAQNCKEKPSATLQQGLNFYNQNKLEEAHPLLEQAVQQESRNPDAHAWLAETCRRLKETDKAVSFARKAIVLDPCHSFAHTVLAWAYNPLYSSWQNSNADTTWHHLLKAAECDSNDGNIFIGLWVEAIRRNEKDLEIKALRQLINTGFLTPTLLAYNRWVLRNLPENALLLTNGDWDTFPAVALQEVEHLRQDVAIVNQSLLNTSWYARFIRDRYQIPLYFEDKDLDKIRIFRDKNDKLVTVSKQIFLGWLKQSKMETFPRPITVAATINPDYLSEFMDHLQQIGPFFHYFPEPVTSQLDTAKMRICLLDINPKDFTGSFVSANDPSPVRKTGSNYIVRNITSTALRYSSALLETNRLPEAQKMLTWAQEFEKNTKLGPVFTEHIEKLITEVKQKTN